MAKLDLALVVRTVDQATRPLRRIQQSVRQISRNVGLDRVGRQVRLVGRQMRTVGDEAGRFGRRVAIGIAAAAGGALFFTQRYATAADTIAKTSDRIGIGVEELQRLRYAFDIAGISTRETDKSLLYFTRAIGDAAKGTAETKQIFDAMGISLHRADGTLKSTSALFDEVANAMAKQESPQKRAIAAQYLFGRAGTRLNHVLHQGADEIRKTGAELDDYRLIAEEEARAAEEYIDNQLRMKQAVQGLRNAIAADLIPKLSEATIKIREWVVENRPAMVLNFKVAMGDLAEAFGWLSWGIRQTLGTLGGFIAKIRETFEPADKAIGWLIDFAAELGWAKTAVIVLGAWLAKGLIGAVIGLFLPLAGLVWWIGIAGARMLWLAAALAGPLIARAIPAVIAAFRALSAAVLLPAAVAAVAAAPLIAAIAAIVAAVGVAAYFIYKYWDEIVAYARGAWATFSDTFSDQAILVKVKEMMAPVIAYLEEQDWYRIGSKWVSDLWGGMKAEFARLEAWFKDTFWFLSDANIMRLLGFGGAASAAPAPTAPQGEGARTFAVPSLDVTRTPIPTLGAQGEAVPGADRRRLRHGGRAQVTVDFRNMPRGTRTETRSDSDTDLEVNTGYAMQGAN